MRNLKFATAILATMFATTALADAGWKTIKLRGQDGFTIDVPASIEPEKNLPGAIMAFALQTSPEDNLTCFLSEYAYGEDLTQASVVALLESDRRSTLCEKSGPQISNGHILDSEPATTSGLQAGKCVSSYTDGAEAERPGVVQSTMIVASAKSYYNFTCLVADTDQEVAEITWNAYWKDRIIHMQDSLHVPGAAN
jgi:hypothetical protein